MIPASPKWRVAWRVWIVFWVLWSAGWVGFAAVVSPELLTGESDKTYGLVALVAAPWGALVAIWLLWRIVWQGALLPVMRWITAPLRDH